MDLKEEDILGEQAPRHWYYRSKLAALVRYVQHLNARMILDVGAGSGFFSTGLLRLTDAREALCVDPNYRLESDQLVDGKPVRFRKRCGRADADLVLMMDVLEHVEDDVGLLREYADRVPSATRFLVTVPAFSFLWSGHDLFLEHKRRYRLADLERVVQRAGFVLERGSYFYGLVFPLAVATRLMERLRRTASADPHSQLKIHSHVVNELLAGICTMDLLLLKLNRLAGLTVFCLARKP